ncbi:thyrotropin-releasing hormone receptor-like [Asterias amurensis]|uniref:thyrotropin-releasing hormone receptor-like n=1 Tax=Asterias amurensis TaxID=7602 RepID=UPI003AB4BA4B
MGEIRNGMQCEYDNVLNLTADAEAAGYVVAITEQWGIIVGMLLVLAFGLPGNLAFLFVIYRLPHMRTITNFFLANLAIADISFLLVTVFMYMIFLSSPIRSDYSVASIFSCVGVFVAPHITYFTSTCCVTVVSLERFYAICKPLQHRAVNTKSRAKRLLLLSWVIAAILTAIAMPKYGVLEMSCIIWPDDEKYQDLPVTLGYCRPVIPWWLVVGEVATLSPFAVALPCNVFMYVRIIHTLSSRSVTKANSSQSFAPQALQVRNQVARMLIINGMVFFICQATNQFVTAMYIISSINGDNVNDIYDRYATVLDVGRIAVFVNSAVNPIIYTLSSQHYRKAFREAFSIPPKKSKVTSKKAEFPAPRKTASPDVNRSVDPALPSFRLQHQQGAYSTEDRSTHLGNDHDNESNKHKCTTAEIEIGFENEGFQEMPSDFEAEKGGRNEEHMDDTVGEYNKEDVGVADLAPFTPIISSTEDIKVFVSDVTK